jgi:alpha-L-rhamnosidase
MRGLIVTFLVLITAISIAGMKATDLRCEFQTNPLAIDSIHPRLSWVLKDPSNAQNQRQSAYRILVATSPTLLAKQAGDLWDSRKTKSNEQNNIPYAGKSLKPGQTCFWKVMVWDGSDKPSNWSAPARWDVGLLDSWKATWIKDGKTTTDPYADDPAPLFRKAFDLTKPIARAKLFITGLGYYEATINGQRVGDHVLDPGWTLFNRRVLYSAYDVTKLLAKGENCLGVMLGNGWYNPLPLKMWGNLNLRANLPVGRPRLIAELHIDFADGHRQIIHSDLSWKVGDGPILRNNTYLGEVVDARAEQPGWDKPGFKDSEWRTPAEATETVGKLVAQAQPPIRVTAHWRAARVTEPKKGTFIYDMGTNLAGWVRLKLNVARGIRVQLRYGELLHADGTLNPMTSVAGQVKSSGVGGPGAPDVAVQSDTYIAKGGEESYQPRFTFRGFRFVEITGLSKALPLDAVTALRLNSDVTPVGTFECSNPMLNQIQEMCRRTFLSNIFSVQSDCPHREKFGYGGDIVATSEALMSNFDMATFYAKAVQDWADSARPDGMFTDTAPFVGIQYCGVVWAMAHPLLATQLGQYYGNKQITRDQYEAAKRWLQLVETQYPDGIVKDGLSDHEGLAPAPAPEMVTPLYYHSLNLLARMAHQLSLDEDEAHFTQVAARVKQAYTAKFIDARTGKVGPGTQASQAIGLYTGIATEKALEPLMRDIEVHKGHLTTGILGTKFMLDVLSRNGHADLAYRIVTQPDFPGWGWMLKNGATTLWEHWELSDNTFSHNHPMFGSVSQWMMQWLGGIQPDVDSSGFDTFAICPQTVTGLDWVKSNFQSIRGNIVSNWSRKGDSVRFEIEIPVNCRAQVTLPAASPNDIAEDTKPLTRQVRQLGGSVTFAVGSGTYSFVVRTSNPNQ